MSSQHIYQAMPMRTEPSRFFEPVLDLTREAGRRIMEVYHSDFRVGLRPDDSLFTAADLASHHCLVEGLESMYPHHPVLSEESGGFGYATRSPWESFWLVDPLDGTREFIRRNGDFTVNVALIHRHEPVFGVVYAPARDLAYFASEGCGAFRQSGRADPESIRVRARAPATVRVAGGGRHDTVALGLYLSRLGEHEFISVGSSLNLCAVAEGAADLNPRIGLTAEWETAAAHCVVREAGGKVTQLCGRPLRYNTKESVLNPYFLVYGDPSRDWYRYAAGIGAG